MLNKKKTFQVQYRHWSAGCEIIVKSEIEKGKRSTHPDFEDRTPVDKEKFTVSCFINGQRFGTIDETYNQNDLPAMLKKLEEAVRASALQKLRQNEGS